MVSDGLTNMEEPRSVKHPQILLQWRKETRAGGAHQNSDCDSIVQFKYAGNGYSNMYPGEYFLKIKKVCMCVKVSSLLLLLYVKFSCVLNVEMQKWIDINFRIYTN